MSSLFKRVDRVRGAVPRTLFYETSGAMIPRGWHGGYSRGNYHDWDPDHPANCIYEAMKELAIFLLIDKDQKKVRIISS